MNKYFEKFPRNKVDYFGRVVLYSKNLDTFFDISFGCGDNLTQEDVENGYDDYLNISSWKVIGDYNDILKDIKEDIYLDEIDGLEEYDGGMLLVKRADYNNSGDIRDYLENALDMGGYGVSEDMEYGSDLTCVYIGD